MDSQWLKTQFKLAPHKSKTGLAKAMGLEPPAISKILKGTRQIKAHEYAAMRRYFDLPVDGEKSLDKNKSYVLAPLARRHMLAEDDRHQPPSEWIIPANILNQRTQASPDQVRIFQIQENTMAPAFQHGDHVLVDLSSTAPSPPGIFIISDGFGYMPRQCEYLPKSSPAQIKVSTKNENFAPQIFEESDLDIIGRVIAKLQWL